MSRRAEMLALADEMERRFTSTKPLYAVEYRADDNLNLKGTDIRHPVYAASKWCEERGYRHEIIKNMIETQTFEATRNGIKLVHTAKPPTATFEFRFFHKEHAALFKLFWQEPS